MNNNDEQQAYEDYRVREIERIHLAITDEMRLIKEYTEDHLSSVEKLIDLLNQFIR